MEEIEVPTEHLHEEMHHAAEHAHASWVSGVALTSALLAVLTAVTALLAGHHANEAMVDHIKASDQWSYYQAKGIKASVLGTKMDLIKAMGKEGSPKDEEKLEQYKKDQEEISEKAKEHEHEAESHMQHHMVFARGVTMFQVAIGIAAISALTRRKKFWFVGLAFGCVGIVFLIQGFLLHG